jgi:hypothetical protein
MRLVTGTPLALEIGHCTLTNRVGPDDDCLLVAMNVSPGAIMWAPVQIMWAGGLGQNQ